MHRLCCLLTCILFFGAATTCLAQRNINVKTNKNIELLGIMVSIVNGPQIPELKDSLEVNGTKISWQQWYGDIYRLYQQFNRYDTSKALQLYKAYAEKGMTDDFFAGALLQVSEVPNAVVTSRVDTSVFLAFGGQEQVVIGKNNFAQFLEAMNQLARSMKLNSYLEKNKAAYDKMVKEVETAKPSDGFVAVIEKVYQKQYAGYTLVPSLTMLPSTGFGKFHARTKQVYIIFGPFRVPANPDLTADRGFLNPSAIQGLSIHEFSHPFVNPVIDNLPSDLLKESAFLYDTIKNEMMSQGYMNWTSCLYEHFVRAGEVIIARKMGDEASATSILKDNEKKGYRYLPFLVNFISTDESVSFPHRVEAALRALLAQNGVQKIN